MKIIITGGTGMIGTALIQELARENHEIIALSRNPANAHAAGAHIKFVQWDGKTAQGWGHLADGADAIVNLAGESIAPLPWTAARKERIRSSRVNAGRAIVEAVQNANIKPRMLVQTSGVNYYGAKGSGSVAVTESAPQGNDFLASVAGDWEAATAPVEALGVRRAIYRTGIVLSRTGGVLPLMSLPFRFFAGGPIGDGKQWIPWIHIADEIAGIRFLIENENARGVFNFTAPNPVTNADWSEALGRALHRPSWFPTPAFGIRAVFGQMADELLLSGQRVIPQRLLELGFQFQYPTVDEALQNLYGRTPQPSGGERARAVLSP